MSVIIPTYNYGHFLGAALESVFAQTYQDFEVLVVDDGSTDDTRARVDAFGARVRYLYQHNTGLSAARNTGIEASHGGLIALLDADDIWTPRKLERQVAQMDHEPHAGFGYCWWDYIDETGSVLPQTARPSYRGQVFEDLLRGPFAAPSTWLIRRTCLGRVGLFDPAIRTGEDWDLMLRIAGAGYPFTYVSDILMRNRLHKHSLSQDVVKTIVDDHRPLAKALRQFAPDANRTRLRKTACRRFYTSRAARAEAQGNRARADAWLAKAVRLDRTVSRRPAFYLGLAFDLLPFGHRTTGELRSRLDTIAATLKGMTERLLSGRRLPAATAEERQAVRSALYLALAILYGRFGRWGGVARWLCRSLTAHPLTAVTALGRGARRWRGVRAALGI